MSSNQNTNKQLLKILIGAAWIDGVMQSEERTYLDRMAVEQDVADDPEIQALLATTDPVKPAECYGWLESYLGSHPKKADYNRLLEAMSALIYSDSDVDTEEAKLLSQLQSFSPDESPHSVFDRLLRRIRTLYQQSLSS
ncbi:MAG: TerB family tellurite resistance protein [Cyanophyceae cyanobacterium]